MGFFDDFTNALETYPETGVQLEIVAVSFPDSVLNVEETATFRVKVTNTGPLNLTDVSLRIKGLNGATVANNGAASPFVSEFVTQTIESIAAHGGSGLRQVSDLLLREWHGRTCWRRMRP